MTHSLDLTALRDAIASLQGGITVVSNPGWFSQQNEDVQNTLISGVVKNFEFVFEISVKMIRRVVELESDSPADVDETSFRGLLRAAGEKGLVADVEAWFRYRRMRNVTAHTYDHDKAAQVYRDSVGFIADARALLAALESRFV
jgi:nucleotidyltransferase substrate binding protein (TIGR01987 family)